MHILLRVLYSMAEVFHLFLYSILWDEITQRFLLGKSKKSSEDIVKGNTSDKMKTDCGIIEFDPVTILHFAIIGKTCHSSMFSASTDWL